MERSDIEMLLEGCTLFSGKHFHFRRKDNAHTPYAVPNESRTTSHPDGNEIGASKAVRRMLTAQERLNASRAQLSGKETGSWHKHTATMNFASDIVYQLRRKLNIEMCTIAWTKLYDILCVFDLIPPINPVQNGNRTIAFRSSHICEAPGAFIAATNHRLRSLYGSNMDWKWSGSTLNPFFEENDYSVMIDDDRFILHTIENWHFGNDESGDILRKGVIESLWKKNLSDGKVDLVTADGSIDCSADPNRQEETTAPLHFAEAVYALGALRLGGNLVMKMFTLFEESSVTLLALLYSHFTELAVTKPVTSKPGNSEVYIVAKGFQGIADSLLQELKDLVGSSFSADKTLFNARHRPSLSFLSEIEKCSAFFADHQIATIERNVALEGKVLPSYLQILSNVKYQFFEQYLQRCSLHDRESLPLEWNIVPGKFLSGENLNSRQSAARKQRKRRLDVSTFDDFCARKQKREAFLNSEAKTGTWIKDNCSSLDMRQQPDSIAHDDCADEEDQEAAWRKPHIFRLKRGKCSPAHFGTKVPILISESKRLLPALKYVILSRFADGGKIQALYEQRERLRAVLHQLDNSLAKTKNYDVSLQYLDPVSLPFQHLTVHEELKALVEFCGPLVPTPCNSLDEETVVNALYHANHARNRVDCIVRLVGETIRSSQLRVLTTRSFETNCRDNFSFTIKIVPEDFAALQTDQSTLSSLDLVYVDLELGSIRDVLPNSRNVEMLYKQEFLRACYLALALLKPGGNFVCRIFDTLSRFTVGLIAAIRRSFKMMTVFRPAILDRGSVPTLLPKYFVFHSYDPVSDASLCDEDITRLRRMAEGIKKENVGEFREVIDIATLLKDANFNAFMTDQNEQLMQLEIEGIQAFIRENRERLA